MRGRRRFFVVAVRGRGGAQLTWWHRASGTRRDDREAVRVVVLRGGRRAAVADVAAGAVACAERGSKCVKVRGVPVLRESGAWQRAPCRDVSRNPRGGEWSPSTSRRDRRVVVWVVRATPAKPIAAQHAGDADPPYPLRRTSKRIDVTQRRQGAPQCGRGRVQLRVAYGTANAAAVQRSSAEREEKGSGSETARRGRCGHRGGRVRVEMRMGWC